MPRYIMTHKRAGVRSEAEHRSSRKLLEDAMKQIPPSMLKEHLKPEGPGGRRTIVLEATSHEIAKLKKSLPPGLILEKDIRHRLHVIPTRATTRQEPSIQVEVQGAGKPLESTRITVYVDDQGTTLPLAFTDISGRSVLPYGDGVEPRFAVAEPDGGFWSMFKQPARTVRFNCPPLPRTTPLEWWHRAVGVNEYDLRSGKGIRVGIVGTGVGPHPRLRHVKLTDGDRGRDIERHETHVCGIIAARPKGKGELAGIAPGAEVFSTRVFNLDSADHEPVQEHQGVIAHAIERLARSGNKGFAVDLINLSFGSPTPSRILRDAIQWAFEHGTLCICSAGNNLGGNLDYPAAFRETVAVTALGKKGWGPRGSTGKHWVPLKQDRFGDRDLYLASMSSIGTGVECAAPGNGIISTIPQSRRRRGAAADPAPYAAMDGTSLSSPMACGVLAVLLSHRPDYLAMPRTAARARMARDVLRSHCKSLGLKPQYEGYGLPVIG